MIQGELSNRIIPGIYSLQVESMGFVSFRQELTCKTSETVSVDPLRLGLMGEVVEVKSEHSAVLRKLRSLFRGADGAFTARAATAC
jgi:hypothetical protein